jgi:uncharacterized protein (DUF1800 family)
MSQRQLLRNFPPFHRLCTRLAILAATALLTACATAVRADTGLRPADAQWLDRVTYGLDSATVQRFRELGRQGFLDAQLAARDDKLPAPIQAQIDAMDISRIPATQLVADAVAAQKQIKLASDTDKQSLRKQRNQVGNRYLDEVAQRQMLRAIYSPDQLKEQMVWFWLNHFSVFARKGAGRWLVADYEERAIRPHALGHFRDLVIATLTHPAMLIYLDNAQNAVGKANENYARELMELHTLGVSSGYSQRDVQELARVLTGVGVDVDLRQNAAPGNRLAIHDGLFAFYPARHDFGDKTLLGHRIHGSGFGEVEQAVNLIVAQPACAHFISKQIAQYFVADDPPAALVEAMAKTFQRSDGDIAAVLRTLFESREFAASLGKKFKDPMHYVVSASRLVLDGTTIPSAEPMVRWVNAQGEALFGHLTPDGYPLAASGWASSGQLSRRFEIARAIGAGNAVRFVRELGMPPTPEIPDADSPLYAVAIRPQLSTTTLAAIAQGKSPQERNAFLLASPEFNYR